MVIDLEDEILQDFLVEAGEIIEQLGGQLIDLEQSPEDYDLLNSIFRGFHTVKGGAGFLSIDPLVEICHQAEDVFDVLRQGKKSVTPSLMDTVLQVLDLVGKMFDQIRSAAYPDAADESLLESLKVFKVPEEEQTKPVQEVVDSSSNSVIERKGQHEASRVDASLDHSGVSLEKEPRSDEITEQEFEGLLDALHGSSDSKKAKEISGKDQKNTANDGEITEEEFDGLLDKIHGAGQHKGLPIPSKANNIHQKDRKTKDDQSSSNSSDVISEDEFEDLLDELHGKGKHAGVPAHEVECKSVKQSKEVVEQFPDEPKLKEVPRLSEVAPAIEEPATARQPQIAKQKTTKIEATVRVDTQRLDNIMNLVGELVLVRNRFETLKGLIDNDQMGQAISNLDVVTADLQLAVMKTRMQPVKKVFGRFPRLVRDLARNLNKEVRLELRGEETDLDKNLVENLADPLIHLVRNAIDHGIEMPDERAASGKTREGLVMLSAFQEGDHIQLTIEDDGKGINPGVLSRKAMEKGLIDQSSASRMTDDECYNLIFLPGFSTKTEISDVSGRGVGMDVVKTAIVKMNGMVHIESLEGRGSRVVIKVPLTMAIMPALMVKLNDRAFAFPLSNVVEILELDLRKTSVVDGQLVAIIRNQALPLFYLKEWLVPGFHRSQQEVQLGDVVVVTSGDKLIGFVVDQLMGQEEVVIKALGAKLKGLPGIAGATITGDGRIALILDMATLITKYAA